MCKLKTLLWINVVFFSVVGLFHLLRLLFQWEVSFRGVTLPIWLSVVGIIVIGFLLYFNSKHLKQK